MIRFFRSVVSAKLNKRAMRKYRSALGWRDAPKFENYLKNAQKTFVGKFDSICGVEQNVKQFIETGVTSIWTPESEDIANTIITKLKKRESSGEILFSSDATVPTGHESYNGDFWLDFPEFEKIFHGYIGAFLQNYFKTYFKIYYCLLNYSKRTEKEARRGSQIWHNDGGPGTCVILGFYLQPTDDLSGCTEVLPWKESLTIYEEVRSMEPMLLNAYIKANGIEGSNITKHHIRIVRDRYYREAISSRFRDKVVMSSGKAGLMVAFSNNLLHRGGYIGEIGRERYLVLLHCYPSNKPTQFDEYRRNGLSKLGGMPKSPAF